MLTTKAREDAASKPAQKGPAAEARGLIRGSGDAVRSSVEELREAAHHAVGAARHGLEDARHAASNAGASVTDAISRRPLAAVGIAAGLGLLIALTLFRKRS